MVTGGLLMVCRRCRSRRRRTGHLGGQADGDALDVCLDEVASEADSLEEAPVVLVRSVRQLDDQQVFTPKHQRQGDLASDDGRGGPPPWARVQIERNQLRHGLARLAEDDFFTLQNTFNELQRDSPLLQRCS